MTAAALAPPPLTVADFLLLDEDERYHYELQEGVVMVTNKPKPRHQRTLGRLVHVLDITLPPHLVVVPDISVDLELAASSAPGFVRAPDLVVVTEEEHQRVLREGGILRASGTVLVGEIHSPGGVRRDTVIKRGEYADAGISHYWMVDLHGGPSLTACHLGGPFGYVDDAPATGTSVTDVPFSARLDLGALL